MQLRKNATQLVRALHWNDMTVGSIPARGPILFRMQLLLGRS